MRFCRHEGQIGLPVKEGLKGYRDAVLPGPFLGIISFMDRREYIQALLSFASYCEKDSYDRVAENLYLQAIREAERTYGPDRPETGLVIIRCVDFYDRHGRELDSSRIWKKMKPIASRCLEEAGRE